MATSDVEILEQYLLSLTNAGSQPAIVEIMDEFGYGPERRPEARARLDDAFAAHHRRCFSNMDSTASCRKLRKSIISIRPHRWVESGINYVYLYLSGLKIKTYGH